MLDNLKKYNLILASTSPRRKELLQRLGVDFKVRTLLGIDERYPSFLKGENVAKYIATTKGEGYASSMQKGELLITADTIVCIKENILCKPHSITEAKIMLQTLSGNEHSVITGVCLITENRREIFAVTSLVKFSVLSEEEIDFYINKYLPLDKAGAYGIQDWIGLIAIESIKGCYTNVMGLPIERLYHILKTF